MIAIYVRVSSKSQTLASQLPDLKKWVKANAEGEEVVFFTDHFTGKTMDRPGWQRVQTALEAGEVKTLVCWRMDRLGRTASGVNKLIDFLTARKIGFVSVREGLDISTPAGRMMAGVIASFAQYETEVRRERAIAGQEVAREKGKHLGRPKGVHTRVKVTAEAETMIRRMKAEGVKVAAIARAVSLNRKTVYSVLA